MALPNVTSERLEFVFATAESLRAELSNLGELSCLLNAQVPQPWPPLLEDGTGAEENRTGTERFAQLLEKEPDRVGWSGWYWIRKEGRVLVGKSGFYDKPSADGSVMIGYAVHEQFRRKGYATEAVHAMSDWAFSHPGVTRVLAETFPHLISSIGVLTKNHFTLIGEGSEAGTIRYELKPTS
jgi:RimJ/RimL family protein N-acetyltransferase